MESYCCDCWFWSTTECLNSSFLSSLWMTDQVADFYLDNSTTYCLIFSFFWLTLSALTSFIWMLINHFFIKDVYTYTKNVLCRLWSFWTYQFLFFLKMTFALRLLLMDASLNIQVWILLFLLRYEDLSFDRNPFHRII